MLKYWEIIHWDPSSFLTIHDGYASRIYHDKLAPNLFRDVGVGLRGLVGGGIRIFGGLISSFRGRASVLRSLHSPFALLITIGTAKYAGEEEEIIVACKRRGYEIVVLHVSARRGISTSQGDIPMGRVLTPADHLWVLFRWITSVFSGLKWCLCHGGKSRALFFASLYSMAHHYSDVSLSNRLLSEYGRPLWALSLCPSTSISRAVVGQLKKQGVLTAAIRTQTTSYALEHIGINTAILFCKSPHERLAYEEVFCDGGPRLGDGCLLSLPAECGLEPLHLPDRYSLLLGTAPSAGQNANTYARYNQKLFQIAISAGLPAVFKGHNLAKALDAEWFSGGGASSVECRIVEDIGRNRELIARASLVVTTASTLLYYAILCQKPVILVEAEYNTRIKDEFESAPITRIRWSQDITINRLDWSALATSARAARRWFEETYFLEKGPGYLVDFLVNESGVDK